jgi:hypothetical protein
MLVMTGGCARAGATVAWTCMAAWAPVRQGQYPGCGDLDGDQDVDLVLCQPVCALENVGSIDQPSWTRHDAWVDGLAPTGEGVRAEMGDLDADGDMDLLFGVPLQGIIYYENTGGPGNPAWQRDDSFFCVHQWGMSAPSVADLDGDGDLDIIVGCITGACCYWNDGTPSEPWWRLDTAVFAGIELSGNDIDMTFGDLDGDGDPDLVTAPSPCTGALQAYENAGALTSGEWKWNPGLLSDVPQPDALTGACLADLNADAKLDLLLFDIWQFRFYRNDREDSSVEPVSWGSLKARWR